MDFWWDRGLEKMLTCPALGFPELRRNTLQALRLAKKCGDRVAIVSLSERPWVFESADQYLPGPIEKIWKGECFECFLWGRKSLPKIKKRQTMQKESDRDLQSKRVFVYLVARPVARISRMRFQGCFFDRFWNLHFAPCIPKLSSFDILLTGLDMEALLRELQIPVYYAPEHATTRFPPAETAALQHADFASQEIKIWSDISVSYH